eukprot:Gb_03839 [translate_table: standard]
MFRKLFSMYCSPWILSFMSHLLHTDSSLLWLYAGTCSLSSSWHTLLSGFLAVISVNLVIGLYIFMALKEPSASSHQPDPAFLAQAKASVDQTVLEGNAIRADDKKDD